MRQAHVAGPSGSSARVVLTTLFKDKWKLAAAFVLTFAVAAVLASLVTPKYVASAQLYVKYGREYTYRTQSGTSEVVTQAFDREQILRSEAAILVAADTVGAVVEKIGAARLYPRTATGPRDPKIAPEDEARELMLANLDAEAGNESNVVAVAFQHPDRQIAAEALGALIDAYLAKRRPLFADLQAANLEREANAAKIRLGLAEADLEHFQVENSITVFDAERRLLLEQQGALARDLQSAQSSLAAAREQALRLRQDLDAIPSTIVLQTETQRNPVSADAQRALLDLRLRDAELQADWGTTSPPVVQVRRGIVEVERMLGELEGEPQRLVRTGTNPIHESLTTQLTTASALAGAEAARKTAISGQLADARQKIARISTKERRLNDLVRERDLAGAAYMDLARRLDGARLLDKLALEDDANVRVLQAPHVPVSPKNIAPLILAAGFLGAVFATLTTAFLSDLLRSGYLTPEQLERATGLPVLAAVPKGLPPP